MLALGPTLLLAAACAASLLSPGYFAARKAAIFAISAALVSALFRPRPGPPRPPLRTTFLTEDLFAAAAMRAVEVDLMTMKVAQLKEELEARDEAKTGNKAWLRRRLHAAIVREHLEGSGEEV